MLTKPKAVLFDWDNTLADTWPVIHAALCEALVAMGHEPWDIARTKTSVHRSMRDYFPELFGEGWEKAGLIYQQSYRRIRTEKLEALPQAGDLLSLLLRDKDIYVAVVSNKIGTSLREEIIHLAWEPYFAKAVGAGDAAEDKPSIAPVYMALEGSGIVPGKDIWFIGDSLSDMQCAHNAGCVAIFYGDGDPTSAQYADCPPARHVRDHLELIDLLEGCAA